jgi:hypothetical protein
LAPEPEPAFSPPPPPPPSRSEPAFATTPAPKPAPSAGVTPTPSRPSASPGEYTHRTRVTANERVLQWVPIACVVVIFFLQFLPWVGVFPGGVPAVTQSAWGAAFGGYTQDPDMAGLFEIITEEKARQNKEEAKKQAPVPVQEMLKGITMRKDVSNEPGVSLLCLFYLLFFLATLALTIVFVAESYVKAQLPPKVQQAVQQLQPLKWTLLAGLNAILVLFLGLQLLLSFSLESRMKEWITSTIEAKKGTDVRLRTDEQKQLDAIQGNLLGQVRRTFWLRLAFLLQLLAAAAAGLVYWMERRGPSRPPPYLEFGW